MRRFARLLALLAGFATLAAGPASADPHVVVVTGSGTISPGLTLTPTFQNVTFTADLVVGTIVATNCTFVGSSSIAETDLVGRGSGTLSSCVGASVSGNIQYHRQGVIVTLSGNVTVNGHAHVIGLVHCEFGVTSVNPSTSFYLHCTVTLS